MALKDVEGIEWILIALCISNRVSQDVLDVIRDEKKVCNYIDIPLQT